MNTSELKYWVGFNHIPGIGRVRLGQLESHFGNLETAWSASTGQLNATGLDAGTVKSIDYWRPRLDLDVEMEKMARAGVLALTFRDDAYPARLKQIYDYPPLIYVKGQLLPEDDWCLAVVGTRKPTLYGRQVTEELVAELVANRITIVSGLARGIDAIAHQAALGGGGRGIAVFGCGLDVIYPSENAGLASRIAENGTLISEYPLGARPRIENFPRRNRILSGLSLGVLVTEAGETSGALITARLAVEQNREVFAVPGNILSPSSNGCNRLIQEGAKLVRCGRDILEELNLTGAVHQAEVREVLPATEMEATLLGRLSAEPSHIDQVCRACGLPMAAVSSTLAMMELKGMVRQVGAMNYVLAREARETYRVTID